MAAASPSLNPAAWRRYNRQILLDEIGLTGQQKLADAKVLIVGAGGLGSPAALYLAAAGIGTLGIADLDLVEEHNLQRQLLHITASIGQPKIDSAAARIEALNPLVKINLHAEGITTENAVELFSQYDIILDGTDNFPTRYLNNDAAFLARRPLVHGSIYKFEGQVTVFDPANGGPCYRCLFPEPPPVGSIPGCGEAGVIGALCGVIGSMQALEVVKIITGIGSSLRGRLLTYNALDQQLDSLNVAPCSHCPLCGSTPGITSLKPEHYRPICEPSPRPSMNESACPFDLSITEAHQLLIANPDGVVLIDVRENHELEICCVKIALHIPMRQIPEQIAQLPRDRHLLIMCHHGGRSRRVTEYLRAQGLSAVSNIDGGVNAWAEKIDPSMAKY